MLADAESQRQCIKFANIPFNWECYPTYFGSQRLFIPKLNALTYIPQKRSVDHLNKLADFGNKLSEFAKHYPDKRFVVYIVQGYSEPAMNPAIGLIANPTNPTEQATTLSEAAKKASNVTVLTSKYYSLDEYYNDFFKTDHHWNFNGCEHAYNQIAASISLEPAKPSDHHSIKGYAFSGATARYGRNLVVETVVVSDNTFDYLEIQQPNGTPYHYNHDAFFNRSDPGKRYGFYDSYYDFIQDGATVIGNGQRTCLFICNSYGGGIIPYIASNYSSTKYRSILHPSRSDSTLKLNELLNADTIDDIIILANPSDIDSFISKCPDFFIFCD